jgi:hypothetical protein
MRLPSALQTERSHGPERRRQDGVGNGHDEAVGQRLQHDRVVERDLEPADAEALEPGGYALGVVEREQDDHQDRQVEEQVDHAGVDPEPDLDQVSESIRPATSRRARDPR